MDVKEQANPIFNTAKFTLYNLSKSGVKEAEKYLEALGFQESQIASYGMTGDIEDKMTIPNLIVQEARYCFINRLIEEKGYKNIFDLACGFSPRGYKYSQMGYKYVGADLPATVEIVDPVAKKVMDDSCKIPIEYCGLDLTNPKSVLEAAKTFDGPICITTEGLLVYLDKSETAQFAESVRAVLKEHGGCFITPDYASGQFFMAVMFSMYGQEEGMRLLMESKKALEKTSDATISSKVDGDSLSDARKGDGPAAEFFAKRGLKVDRVPFYEYSSELVSLKNIEPEVAERIKVALNRVMSWVVTLDEEYSESTDLHATTSQKETSFELCGDVLNINMCGRVDSVSAPELITRFEELSKVTEISSALVDMKQLEYISSAGLRFLLMMKKHVSQKQVALKNVSSEVMEILELTGFSDILDII